MQEDIEQRTISVSVKASNLTGRVLKAALVALLRKMAQEKAKQKAQEPAKPGNVTMTKLAGHDGGADKIEVSGRIRSFERIAKEYGVRYHIKKEIGTQPPKWTVYFKANQAGALTDAFRKYTRLDQKRDARPSLLAQLAKMKELVKNLAKDRVKSKEQGGPEL
ncbi:hypothetical protein FACS1894104_0510 [Actinomycetota bacterium]|nr:hypothetical protein FACS1894104_0510 [Actinomycetota bacterium]